MLIFMLFQHFIVNTTKVWNTDLSTFFRRLDEFTIIIFFFLALIEFYKNKEFLNRSYYILLSLILISICLGVFSGMVNKNPLLMTIHGTFDNIKYFLVLLIYAAFFREFKDFKKIFEILLIFAILMGFIAFIQEIWVLISRYIFKVDIQKIFYLDFYHFLNPGYVGDHNSLWRLGIFRVSSFMVNANIMGLYCLLILTIYSHTVKKINVAVFISLFSGIFGSVSRVVFSSFLLLGAIQVLKGKKLWIFALIPIVLILFYFSPLPKKLLPKTISESPMFLMGGNVHNNITETEVDKENWDLFRGQIRGTAIKIWKENVLFGIGPAAYGSALSLKYNPSVYEYKTYKFLPLALLYLKEWKDPDQYWPVLLAQVGIAGTACFAALFMYLLLKLYRLKNRASSDDTRNLCTGLLLYTVVVLIYTFGYSLNIPPVLFTFFAFVGIALGLNYKR